MKLQKKINKILIHRIPYGSTLTVIFNSEIEREIGHSVKEILKDKKTITNEISRLAQFIKESGIVCTLHKHKSPLAKEDLPCLNCVYHKEG